MLVLGWTLLIRVLVNFGSAFGTSLLLYFRGSDNALDGAVGWG